MSIHNYLGRLAMDFECPSILVSGLQVQHLTYRCPYDRIALIKSLSDLLVRINAVV